MGVGLFVYGVMGVFCFYGVLSEGGCECSGIGGGGGGGGWAWRSPLRPRGGVEDYQEVRSGRAHSCSILRSYH